ncbi:hypothetical protein SAMN04488003_101135 [Loktanella fryxellensis]|uniref:Uncharacterized protein n=1 Tax=Loktanella fryxellensis TaxID=245187 RepID=A0A1H7YGU2_9RHOB|nr:hypothetical protein [Loktanella fryxellensis]SEM44379.1 hypothetical protein SAMN04488003_101135 [Loktanella fryxellensis]
MTAPATRRIQITAFALAHIPLAATATVLASDGVQGDLWAIVTAFGATLVTAVALVIYLGQALSPSVPARSATPEQAR